MKSPSFCVRARLERVALGLLTLMLACGPTHADRPAALDEAERTALRKEIAAALSDRHGADRFHAEVWLTAHDDALARYMPAPRRRLELLTLVYSEARRHGIDPELALAVIEVESGFQRFAISSAGAQGLMQVMPFWKHALGRPGDNLTVMRTNVRYGMAILAHYLERESGDVVRALGRYHGSRGRAYPQRVLRAWNAHWRTTAGDDAQPMLAACRRHALRYCGARY